MRFNVLSFAAQQTGLNPGRREFGCAQPGRSGLLSSRTPRTVGQGLRARDDIFQPVQGDLDDLGEDLHLLLDGATQARVGEADGVPHVDGHAGLLRQQPGQARGELQRRLHGVEGGGQRLVRIIPLFSRLANHGNSYKGEEGLKIDNLRPAWHTRTNQ